MSEPTQSDSSQPITLTSADAARYLAGRICPACGVRKAPGHALCVSDFAALTIWQRKPLQSPASPGFLDGYRIALEHLRGLASLRRVRLLGNGARWTYRSTAELEAAGYVSFSYDRCSAPNCHAEIIWYWTPSGRKIAIDLGFADRAPIPHLETCCNLDWHLDRQRQRALRTSAGRKGRR